MEDNNSSAPQDDGNKLLAFTSHADEAATVAYTTSQSVKRKVRLFLGILVSATVVIPFLAFGVLVLIYVLRVAFKPNLTTCLNNIRRLATATAMFSQDHKQYPGVYAHNPDGTIDRKHGWAWRVIDYVERVPSDDDLSSSDPLLNCPSVTTSSYNQSGGPGAITYGYNANIVNASGFGVPSAKIIDPAHLGVIIDSTPLEKWETGGGLIGKSPLPNVPIVTPDPRHSHHCIIGYADGHATLQPRAYQPNDPNDAVNQSFYHAVDRGYISKK